MGKYELAGVTRDRWCLRSWYIGPIFDGPLPQGQLDVRSHGHSKKGKLYTYIHTLLTDKGNSGMMEVTLRQENV